jgi:hypothetical protein
VRPAGACASVRFGFRLPPRLTLPPSATALSRVRRLT